MKTFFKILLVFLISISVTAMAATIVGAIYLERYSNSKVDESLLQINQVSSQTSFYYYDFDNRLSRIGEAIKIEDAYIDSGVKYKFVPYDEIPQALINAFVAIEDKRFYEHNGIDYKRSIKAVFNYVLGGKSTFGGSTITQQLIKNLTGNDGFTVSRKLSEAFSAMDIEKSYDKTQIMEMYLNIINLSCGCRGVGAAAEYFYSKSSDQLTLDECATIAAITNNPTMYDPSRYPERNMHRRNLILKCMLEQGYINQVDYQNAVSAPIQLNLSTSTTSDHVNSWYIDMVINDVIEELCNKYDMSRENASLMLYRGGYKIYTAMDHDVQRLLDEYYSNPYNFPIDSSGDMPQSSMIVIDPYTSDILGVAGAIGPKSGNRIQNYATDSKRPSGSAIKPLSVYAPAIEKGIINWSTIICDSPVKEATPSSRAWPANANNIYVGDVTVKYAIANSLNTVAVKVLNMHGRQESFNFLTRKLKIKNLDPKADIGEASLALGQHSNGITLRELTSAYSMFAEGTVSMSRSYFKVTDTEGRIILDNPLNQEFAISEESAAIMTKLLQSVVTSGTASGKIGLADKCEVAGKTGTTQNNCDKYFIGYTPDILAGVWFGYEYPRSLHEFGGNFSITVWDELMQKIYSLRDNNNFKSKFIVPDSVGKLTYNVKTGNPPTANESPDEWEEGWFLQQNK